MKKIVATAQVLKNRQINFNVKLLELRCPEICRAALPGQFVHVKTIHSENFLRRPFSIADVDVETGVLTIIYRIVGKGTQEYARLEIGDEISVIGPIGSHFELRKGRPLLIGGGVGIAPLIFLAKELIAQKPILLIGGKNKDEVFWQEFLKPYADKIYITTDDGSVGYKGFTVDYLPEILKQEQIDEIYSCGPMIMMEGIAKLAQKEQIPCQVSLEKRMACGIGVCLGCTFEGKVTGRRRKVCSEGPVFPAEEVF